MSLEGISGKNKHTDKEDIVREGGHRSGIFITHISFLEYRLCITEDQKRKALKSVICNLSRMPSTNLDL